MENLKFTPTEEPKTPKFTFTPTQVATWKKEHGNDLRVIDVIAENDEIIRGVFKKPSLDIMMLADQLGEDSYLKRAELAFNNCFIAGDERFRLEEDLKISAGIQVYGLFKIRAASIEKL